jgi:hypothetical protein
VSGGRLVGAVGWSVWPVGSDGTHHVSGENDRYRPGNHGEAGDPCVTDTPGFR